MLVRVSVSCFFRLIQFLSSVNIFRELIFIVFELRLRVYYQFYYK